MAPDLIQFVVLFVQNQNVRLSHSRCARCTKSDEKRIALQVASNLEPNLLHRSLFTPKCEIW